VTSPHTWRHHARYLAVLLAIAALAALSIGALVGRHPGKTAAAPPTKAQPTVQTAPTTLFPSAPAPTGAATDDPPRALTPAQAASAISQIIETAPSGGVSVAALNTATGRRYAAGADSGMWTASAYKLLLVEELLVHHQRSGTTLSGYEDDLATRAIENSDNAAGYELFENLGGRTAQTAILKRFGMRHSVAGGSDPTFTRISGQDGLILLRNLIERDGPLDAKSRAYLLKLMRNVEPDQRWGVGVVADQGTRFANKNGWLSIDNSNGPGESDGGRWAVTSLGVVTVHGQQVLLSVLTQHNASLDSGINRVEALSKALAAIVAP
jgi:beta-lactamase class A